MTIEVLVSNKCVTVFKSTRIVDIFVERSEMLVVLYNLYTTNSVLRLLRSLHHCDLTSFLKYALVNGGTNSVLYQF